MNHQLFRRNLLDFIAILGTISLPKIWCENSWGNFCSSCIFWDIPFSTVSMIQYCIVPSVALLCCKVKILFLLSKVICWKILQSLAVKNGDPLVASEK